MPRRSKALMHSSFVYVTLLLSLFLLNIGGCSGTVADKSAQEQKYEKVKADAALFIREQMKESALIGISVALVDGQETLWAEGFGYADKGKGIPATKDTFYQIGSISKTFTSLMVARLAQEGRMDLDSPLARYLPKFSIRQRFKDSGPITLRSILSHHSGISDILYPATYSTQYAPYTNRWILDDLANEYTAFPVNYVFSYSNIAITLAGAAVEAVTGEKFADYGDSLLRTIGMAQSSWLPRESFAGLMSKGYYYNAKDGSHKAVNLPYINMLPAGSINSSAVEMGEYIKFMNAQGKGLVLPETMDTMLSAQNTDISLDLDLRIGLAWILSDPRLAYAGQLYWHNGGTFDFMSHLAILRDHRLGVVVLSNTNTGGGAVAKIAQKVLQLALEKKTGLKPPAKDPPADSAPALLSEKKLDAIAGIYITDNGYDVFTRTPEGLEWKQWGSQKAPVKLIPSDNSTFSPPDSQLLQVEFATLSGLPVAIRIEEEVRTMIGPKYTPAPLPRAWRERFGTYRIVMLPPDFFMRYLPDEIMKSALSFELRETQGMMAIIQRYEGIVYKETILEPAGDRLAFIAGLGRNKGEAIEVNKKEELRFPSGLRFVREVQPERKAR